ncbi:hypothetical protein LguiB_031823 [Lonicera macranthoides]
MHNQLRDLGREIVREENMAKPGMHSRLWCSEEASKLWEGRMDSKFGIQCLVGKDFEKLRNLRFLRLGRPGLDGDFKQHLSNLRWLDWQCSGNFWPTNFHLKNLVVLNLSGKNIPDNWKGWSEIKMAKELKVLILSKSYNVRGASFISNFKSLERLSLHCCNNLVDIDLSIWNLTNLRVLNLSNCRGLRTLECSSFSALENLKLSDCNKLCRLDGLEKLKSLRNLNMDHCCDLHILLDLSNFKKLKKLDIVGFKKLTEMQGLDTLELFDVLNMTSCISIERLTGLSNLRMLKELNLASCSLQELDEVGALESLEHLDMHHCRSIERLPDLSNLTKLKEHDMDRPGETDTTENNTSYDLHKHVSISGVNHFRILPAPSPQRHLHISTAPSPYLHSYTHLLPPLSSIHDPPSSISAILRRRQRRRRPPATSQKKSKKKAEEQQQTEEDEEQGKIKSKMAH